MNGEIKIFSSINPLSQFPCLKILILMSMYGILWEEIDVVLNQPWTKKHCISI